MVKKKVSRVISFLLSFQMIFFQGQLAFADKTDAPNNKKPAVELDDFLNFESLSADDKMNLLKPNQELVDNILNKRFDLIPDEILDPYKLRNQMLVIPQTRELYPLSDPNTVVPSIVAHEIKTEIRGNDLVIVGYSFGEDIAEHHIPDLNPTFVVEDKEKVIVSTKSGDLYLLDSAIMMGLAFKDKLPLYKLYSGSETMNLFRNRNNLQMTFLTRGLKPFVEAEVQRIEGTDYESLIKSPIIPKDFSGNPIFEAGDLVVYDVDQNGQRELVAILNKHSINNALVEGLTITAAQGTLFSYEGHKNTFTEKLNEYLQTDFDGKLNEPMFELFGLIEEFSLEDKVEKSRQAVLEESRTGDPLTKKFFGSFDQEKLRLVLGRAKMYKNNEAQSNYDRFNAEQWMASFENILSESEKSEAALVEEQKNADHQDAETLQERIDLLESERGKSDFRVSHGELVSSLFSSNLGKRTPSKQQVDALRSRVIQTMGKLALGVSAAGLSAWAGLQTLEYINPTVAHEFYLSMNSILSVGTLWDTYASGVLKDAQYRWAAFAGVGYLMMLIPLAVMYGYAVVPVLKSSYVLFAPLEKQSGKAGAYAKKARYKMKQWVHKYEDKNIFQRIITISAFPYAVMIKPYLNQMLNLLNQPTVQVWKSGFNPFTKVKSDSHVGKTVGLPEGEAFRLGFNKIAASKKQIDYREKALKVMVSEDAKSKALAWSLAGLAVSHETGIDPATLSLLMSDGLNLDQLKEIYKNKELRVLWERSAVSVYYDLQKIMKADANFDVSKIDMESVLNYYQLAKSEVKKINERPQFRNVLSDLNTKFKNLGSGVGKFWGNFGQSEYDFLTNTVANKYVAKQTWREFSQDHTMVVLLPVVFGVRSDLDSLIQENRLDQVVHHPDYAFNTPPPHRADIGQNLMVHLLMAGPRRMLVMQKLAVVSEENYSPMAQKNISAVDRKEGFAKGTVNWTKNVLNFSKTNLGGYYVKGIVRRLNTIQAGMTLAILMRVGFGGQVPADAVMASMFFWVAAELYFGWPWMVIDVGNSQEQARVAEKRNQHESEVMRILEALRQNDVDSLERSYEKLTQVYRAQGNVALRPVYDLIRDGEKASGVRRGDKLAAKKIVSSLKASEKSALYGVAAELYFAMSSGDQQAIDKAYQKVSQVVEANIDDQILRELNSDKRNTATSLANYSLEHPPVLNKESSLVANATTFGLGAVLTTVLGIALSYDSYNAENLNWKTIGEWAAYSVVFYGAVYTAMSRYMWTRYYLPAIGKIDVKAKRFKEKLKGRMNKSYKKYDYEVVTAGAQTCHLFFK